MKAFFLPKPGFEYVYDITIGLLEGLCGVPVRSIPVRLAQDAGGDAFLREYRRLTDIVEKKLTSSPDQIAIWLPLPRPKLVSPTDTGNGFEALCAMLILSFPEIRWIPMAHVSEAPSSAVGNEAESSAALSYLAHNADLWRLWSSPLFDGEGIRDYIRRRICDVPGGRVSLRAGIAAAIDEETDCAVTHAYTAYRFGFRAHMVTTYGLMKCLFEDERPKFFEEPEPGSTLLFEDVCLNFPDERQENFSQLINRDRVLPGLKSAQFRVFVTSRLANEAREAENNRYIDSLKEAGKKVDVLVKPIGGIFDLWKETSLHRGHNWKAIPTNATMDSEGGHSAPGRLLEIADVLIRRAEIVLSNAATVSSAIHGAVLATDAFELLGGRTPTTSLKALTLRHEFEVLAECMSHGVVNDFDVETRLADLAQDVKELAEQFPLDKRDAARCNGEIEAIGRLVRIFREHYQFDEEQRCLVKVRDLRARLSRVTGRWWERLIAYLFYPAVQYVNFILRSIMHFAACATVVAVFIAALYMATKYDTSIENAAMAGILNFVTLQPPPNYTIHWSTFPLVLFGSVLGLLHFGVLISHVYALVSRR